MQQKLYLRGSNAAAKANTLRINKIIRQVQRNTPETKRAHFFASNLAVINNAIFNAQMCSIIANDEPNGRDGHHIKVLGYQIRYHSTDKNTDAYVMLSKSAIAPVYADFEAVIGGHLDKNTYTEIKELAFLHNENSTGNRVQHTRRFKKPIDVYYSGTAANNAILNALYFVIKNNTGATVNVDYSIVVYYTG